MIFVVVLQFVPLIDISPRQGGRVMAINYLQYSPTYQKTVTRPVRERRAVVASHLNEEYRTPGEGRKTIDVIQNQMGIRRGFSEHGFYKDFRLFRTIYEQYLIGNEKQKANIIAEAEVDHSRDHAEKERDPILHAIWCLWHDDIRTMDDVIRLHAQNMPTDPPPPPEPEVSAKEEKSHTDEQSADKKTLIRRPFDLLAGTIHDVIEAGQKIYRTMEDEKEVRAELEERLSAAEKEIRSLKQKFSDHEQRLAQIEDMLTADPAQLAAIQAAAKRLKRDVVEGLPQHTQIGEYWKEILSTVYRKGFKKSLRDKGLQVKERDAIIEAIDQIMTNPFYPGLETEIRHNGDNGDASMIAGIARGAPYYRSRVGVHRRLIWIVEEKNVHFIETGTKETYTYA